MKMVRTKLCFVPGCLNGYMDTVNLNKVMLTVPQRPYQRKIWCKAVGAANLSAYTFCCEDHFNLETDADNWMQFKLMGSRLNMKKHVVPRLNLHPSSSESQFSHADRKLKHIFLNSIQETKPQPAEFVDMGDLSAASTSFYDESQELDPNQGNFLLPIAAPVAVNILDQPEEEILVKQEEEADLSSVTSPILYNSLLQQKQFVTLPVLQLLCPVMQNESAANKRKEIQHSDESDDPGYYVPIILKRKKRKVMKTKAVKQFSISEDGQIFSNEL